MDTVGTDVVSDDVDGGTIGGGVGGIFGETLRSSSLMLPVSNERGGTGAIGTLLFLHSDLGDICCFRLTTASFKLSI